MASVNGMGIPQQPPKASSAAAPESSTPAPKEDASAKPAAKLPAGPAPAVPGKPEATAASVGVVTVPTFAGMSLGTSTLEERSAYMQNFLKGHGPGTLTAKASYFTGLKKTEDSRAFGRTEITINIETGEVSIDSTFPFPDKGLGLINAVKRELDGLARVTPPGEQAVQLSTGDTYQIAFISD